MNTEYPLIIAEKGLWQQAVRLPGGGRDLAGTQRHKVKKGRQVLSGQELSSNCCLLYLALY